MTNQLRLGRHGHLDSHLGVNPQSWAACLDTPSRVYLDLFITISMSGEESNEAKLQAQVRGGHSGLLYTVHVAVATLRPR